MKVAAGICEYADKDGLYRCLNSLGLGTGGIDKAIIVHGKFNNFPLDSLEAYRETQKIVSRFPKGTIELIRAEGLTEIEARNLYLETAGKLKCDWLLVIDSDEFLARKVTDFAEFRRQLQFVMDLQHELPLDHQAQIFDIQLDGNIPTYHGPVPRLFYRPDTIKYWGKHYWWILLEKSKRLLKGQSDAARIIGGIHLIHDHTIRDSSYYNASILYKEWQQEHEGEEVITQDKPIIKKKSMIL